MFVKADCPWEEHREYTRNREMWQEKSPGSAGPLTVGAMGKKPQTFQNKENSLLPSLTSTRYPLNAYESRMLLLLSKGTRTDRQVFPIRKTTPSSCEVLLGLK
jgi:hypothetical protein